MASSPITVPGLPAAAALTGAEQMPFHQNGRLVRATPEVVVNGVPITPTGGTVGQSIADIAQRVFSPYDRGAVSDAVIASDGTATASLSAAENTARLQAYFNECRDRRLPWVLPLGNWLVDKGITAYGPGAAYGKILAPNDGTVKTGGQPWGAAFELAPYPEDILVPPTLAEIKTWTGCVRGSTQIGGLIGRKDWFITVLTEDQLLVDRRDGGNTNPTGPLNVPPPPTVANPMFFGQGFLVTSDEGQIAAPLIEDWQQAAWQPGTTTIIAQRVRPTIDVVLPDVVLIGPAAANVQDKGGRRAGIRITCCNVNVSGGSVETLTPQVPPLQGVSRANCCNVRQDGTRVFSLGNAGVTYGFNQNLTYNIQDINCSAYGCRRDWDSTRGTDAHVERCKFPDGVGSHYHVRVNFKDCEISCRVTGNPQLIAASGGDWTFEDCGLVLPPAFATVFLLRPDIFKFTGSLHFKGRNRFILFGGDSPRLVLINLRGPATNTGYDTGIVSEMPSSIIVDRTNTIWVTGNKSDGTLSNPALDLLVMGNGWDSYQSKDIRVGGRMYFGPQVLFDNPAPLPGMMVPADPSDPDSETVTIGAGFPKCKIRYINSRKFIGGYYDLTVEGLPDFSAEIFSDTNGSKDLGRVNLDVVGVRGQKRISSTFGGTRKTYIETRDAETVTFEVPPFGAGFDALGDENSNRTYDPTQISAAYGGDVTGAKATVDGALALLPDLIGRRAYATPATRALALLTGVVPGVTAFTTRGYAAPGDGGGATYIEEASNYVATALDIVMSNGRKFRNVSFEVTPQMAGAKADGVTDDRAALRNCLVEGGGRPVRLIGTYLIDSTIAIPSGSVIVAEPGKGALKTGAAFGIFNSDLRSNITIRGVTFIGRGDAPLGKNMIAFTHATRCVLENCILKDHKAPAFIFYLGCSYCGMRGGRIENCGYHTAVNDVSYSAHFSDADAGLTAEQGRDSNRNNFFEDVELVNTAGTGISLQTGFLVRGIRAFSDSTIGLSSNLYITRTKDTIVADSRFFMGPHSGNALDTYVNDGLQVDGVWVYGSGAGGLLLGNAQNVTVTNFHAWDCWSSKGLVYDPVYGIGESVHQGGIVLATDGYGANPGDEPGRNVLRNITISGAKLGNRKSPGTQRYGVHIIPGSDYDDSVRIDEDVKFINNTDADVSAFLASMNGLVASMRGQLQYVSTTQIALKRANGLHVWVNGANRPVPTAGVSFSNTNVVAGAPWYAYVYMDGSTMMGEISATGHVEGASGVRVKSGDPTRTLVGGGLGDTGGLFASTATKRLVRSYYNRVVQSLSGTYSSGTTASTTPVDLNSAFSVQFFCWPDELVDIRFIGDVSNAGGSTFTICGVDGANFGGLQRANGPNINPVGPSGVAQRTEGAHTATVRGYVGAGTGTWTGQIMGRIG